MSYLLSMLATMAKAQVDTNCDLIKLHCNYFNFEVRFDLYTSVCLFGCYFSRLTNYSHNFENIGSQ